MNTPTDIRRDSVESTALFAVIVESSDDGGRSWEIHNIAWTEASAALKAREIPWTWRLRRVRLADAGLIPWEKTKRALSEAEKLEELFSANTKLGSPKDLP